MYLARDGADRKVVLKQLKQLYPDAEALARFTREFEITKAVAGPHIIEAYAFHVREGTASIVLEDFGARSLATRQQPLELEQTLRIAIQVAAALAHLHRLNVVHKDVNPSNIVWNPETGQVKLIDFGISQVLDRASVLASPRADFAGTPAYVSPEQTGRMNRDLDARGDLYSFGVTLYELLTGVRPFDSRDPLELVHAHIAKSPLPPGERVELPGPLSDLVMLLLQKRPEDRYAGAEGLHHDLELCLASLTGSSRPFDLRQKDFDSRLRIPQKLYGREAEIRRMETALEKVARGAVSVLLMAGYSGVGKTSLVREIHRPLTHQRGIYAEGKFDQLNRGTPYAALAEAFRPLMRQITAESEASLAGWRDRLVKAVGGNGQILVDVIPELEHVIGPQPEVSKLDPAEARNRFQLAITSFLRALGSADHPLVLFLDDLQWADLPTLELISRLATDPATSHLLFVGAYRDNEVFASHPLMTVVANMEEEGADIEVVSVGPLQEQDVQQLIGDTVHRAPGFLRLTLACHGKTRGNAFFLNRFLESLYDRGLLSFDLEQRGWKWDLAAIEAESITDNVVDFLSAQILELEPAGQGALKAASCIGNNFDLATLASSLERSRQEALADLKGPLDRGLIRALDEDFWYARQAQERNFQYRFAHDRVQQAAYSLLSQEEASAIHLRIGRALLAESDPTDVFKLVEHLNRAQHLLSHPERQQLCALNLKAGGRAVESAAFESAHQFYLQAHDQLSDRAWTEDYEIAVAVHVGGARAAYLSGHFDVMQKRLETLELRATRLLDRLAGQEVSIHALISRQRLPEAVYLALDVLSQLGFELERKPGVEAIQARVGATLQRLAGYDAQTLASLPEATDAGVLTALRVQNGVIAAAYLAVPELLPILCCNMVETTLEHGVTAPAVYAFSVLGLICLSVGMVEVGYQIGQTSLQMLERWPDPVMKVKTLHVVGGIIKAYVEPLRTILENHRLVYRLGIEAGDLEYAAWGLHNELANSFWAGIELDELAQTMRHHVALLEHYKQMPALACTLPMVHMVNNLRGEPTPGYDVKAHLEALVAQNTRGAAFCCAVAATITRFLFGEYESALEWADRWAAYADGVQCTYQVIAWNQFRALAALRLCTPEDEKTLESIVPQRAVLSQLAQSSPVNFEHRVHLIDAEVARVRGHRGQAHELYDRAIEAAGRNRFVADEALAYELAGRFFHELGSPVPARGYLAQAVFLYGYWGAAEKARQLSQEFADLLPGGPTSHAPAADTTSDTLNARELDLAVVVRASHAISREIVLGDLVQSLVRLAVEAAGARRGLLLLHQPEGWQVVCEGIVSEELELQLLQESLETYSGCPRKLISYVRRTGEEVVLNHASQEGLFRRDAYIERRKSQSVLCLPVKQQNELKAILYLENDLAPAIFHRKHLDLLRLLAAQAAISIENAQLYNTLERRVQERTRELQLEVEERTRVQEELRVLASTDSLTGACNRRHFLELAEREFERSRRYPAPLSVLMLDADHFKAINDTYGHDVGDRVLRALASTIAGELRATEMFGRLGGEEFAVAMPSTSGEGAVVVARRLRRSIANLEVPVEGAVVTFTVSIGVASMEAGDASFASILSRADQALYRAKSLGRDRVESAAEQVVTGS